jgi:hypothetical protein
VGTARFRSWSFSRERTFRVCPRRFLFEYFPHGEPDANTLGLLKKSTCLPMLVGTIAHDWIANALRIFRATGRVKANLKTPALIMFDDALMMSASAAGKLNKGLSVPIETRVLLHHLEEGTFEARENMARDSLANYLDAFEGSSAWEFLQTTELKRWEPIKAATDSKESVLASGKLGFSRSLGLRVYTPIDAAVRFRGDFIIADWKTGTKSASAIASANRQTASYALRALDLGIPLEQVKLAPFWLQAGERWEPRSVQKDEILDVCRGIEEHDTAERTLLKERRGVSGSVEWFAAKDNFPPNVGRWCADCKYRKVCPEGRA